MAREIIIPMPESTDPEKQLGSSPVAPATHPEDIDHSSAAIAHGVPTSEDAQRQADAISAELAGMFPPRVRTAPATPRVDVPVSNAPKLTRRAFVGGAVATTILGALGLKAWASRGTNAATSAPTPSFVDGSKVPGGPAGVVPPADGGTPTARAAVGIADGTMTPTTDPNVFPALQTADAKWGNAWNTAVAGVNTQTTSQGPDRTATPGIVSTPDNRTAVPSVSPTKEMTPVPATYTFSSEILNPGVALQGAENLVEFPFFKGLQLNPEYPNAAEAYKRLCQRVDAGSRVAYANYIADPSKYKNGKDFLRTATDAEIESAIGNTAPAKGFAFNPERVLVDQAVNTERDIIPGPLKVQLAMLDSKDKLGKYLINSVPLSDKLMIRFSVDPQTAGRTMVLLCADESYKRDPSLLQQVILLAITNGLSYLQIPKAFDNPIGFIYKYGAQEDSGIDKLICLPNPNGATRHPSYTKNYPITPLIIPINK